MCDWRRRCTLLPALLLSTGCASRPDPCEPPAYVGPPATVGRAGAPAPGPAMLTDAGVRVAVRPRRDSQGGRGIYVSMSSRPNSRYLPVDTAGVAAGSTSEAGVVSITTHVLGYWYRTDTIRLRAGFVDTLYVEASVVRPLCLGPISIGGVPE